MSDLTWSFSQTFSSQFQTSRSDLEARVENAKSLAVVSEELFKELSTDLARLVKSLAGATGSLPSYDQRQYEEQLKAIELSLSNLRGASQPKSRFVFKRKAATSSPIPVPPSQPINALERPTTSSTPSPTTNLTLSGRSHQFLTLGSLPASSSRGDLSIHDLDHCIVNLLRPTRDDASQPSLAISALHIQNLTDTVLLLPPINGSVLIHGLKRCTIVVGCHQYRMHTSQNVDVYLAITSDPIIEHCSNIRFRGYPSALGPSANDKPLNILDFSHIRSTQSPHWSALGDDRVSSQWPLQNVLSTPEALDATRESMLPK